MTRASLVTMLSLAALATFATFACAPSAPPSASAPVMMPSVAVAPVATASSPEPIATATPPDEPPPPKPVTSSEAADPDPASQAQTPAPTASPAPASPQHACGGVIVVTRNGKTERLASGCYNYRPVGGPYAEVLDPSGDTRFIVEACSATLRFDVVGWTKKLPGPVANVRLRTGTPANSRDSTSTSAQLTVTRFGAVGDKVEGTFSATMTPRFNASPETVSGTFSVCRGPDREPP